MQLRRDLLDSALLEKHFQGRDFPLSQITRSHFQLKGMQQLPQLVCSFLTEIKTSSYLGGIQNMYGKSVVHAVLLDSC